MGLLKFALQYKKCSSHKWYNEKSATLWIF